jgi:hypothetical protein
MAENQITGVELLTPPESAGASHISVMEVLERVDSPWKIQVANTAIPSGKHTKSY